MSINKDKKNNFINSKLSCILHLKNDKLQVTSGHRLPLNFVVFVLEFLKVNLFDCL